MVVLQSNRSPFDRYGRGSQLRIWSWNTGAHQESSGWSHVGCWMGSSLNGNSFGSQSVLYLYGSTFDSCCLNPNIQFMICCSPCLHRFLDNWQQEMKTVGNMCVHQTNLCQSKWAWVLELTETRYYTGVRPVPLPNLIIGGQTNEKQTSKQKNKSWTHGCSETRVTWTDVHVSTLQDSESEVQTAYIQHWTLAYAHHSTSATSATSGSFSLPISSFRRRTFLGDSPTISVKSA